MKLSMNVTSSNICTNFAILENIKFKFGILHLSNCYKYHLWLTINGHVIDRPKEHKMTKNLNFRYTF